MSTVPTSMIFDDHDVRDDWNTSQSWREDMQATDGGRNALSARCRRTGCTSTWATCRPAELAENELYQQVRGFDGDAEQLVREFAAAADREADGAKGARWSYRRDFGSVRLLVIDSRCGRILDRGPAQHAQRGRVRLDRGATRRRLRAPADRHLAALAAAAGVPRHRGLERAAVRRAPRRGWSPRSPRRSAGQAISSTGRRSGSPSSGSPR